MNNSKLSLAIIALFRSNPEKCYTLQSIGNELGKVIDKKSAGRVSLSRCLNRLAREGLVGYEYVDCANKYLGKTWKLKGDCTAIVECPSEPQTVEPSETVVPVEELAVKNTLSMSSPIGQIIHLKLLEALSNLRIDRMEGTIASDGKVTVKKLRVSIHNQT